MNYWKLLLSFLSIFLSYSLVKILLQDNPCSRNKKLSILLIFTIFGMSISYPPITTVHYWLIALSYPIMAYLAIYNTSRSSYAKKISNIN